MDDNNQVVEGVCHYWRSHPCIGSNAEIKKLATAQTQMIDVGGRTIIPGLIDTHLHAIRGGQTYLFETYWYDATTLKSALDELKTTATKRGPGKWVTVAGSWSPAQFEENRAPSIEDLNAALPSNPAYVQYLYDYAILNDKGMEALELNKGGATLPGMEMEKDPQGKPTGKLFGNIGSFSFLLNRISAAKDDERRESLAAYFAVLNSRGVTGIVDAAGGGTGASIYDPLFSLWQEGKLPLKSPTEFPRKLQAMRRGGLLTQPHTFRRDLVMQC